MEKIELKKETTSQAYAAFFSAFFHLKSFVDPTKEGWSKVKLGALTMAAFSIEAHANHIGQHLFKSWKKIERGMSPIGKLKLFIEHLKLEVKYEAAPFQTVYELMKWRNLVAHGTTEMWSSNQVLTREELDTRMGKPEDSEWRAYVLSTDMDRIEKDCMSVMEMIHKSAIGNLSLFLISSWHSANTYSKVTLEKEQPNKRSPN